MEQKQLTQFTFYDLYWDLIKQSDDSAAGRLIQNICKYMFTDEPRQDKGFAFFYAKRSFGFAEYEAGNPPSTIVHANEV